VETKRIFEVGELIMPGEYVVRCVSAQEKQNRKGETLLALEWRVVAGQHCGKTFSDTLNFSSENPTAVQINEDRIYGLAKAMGAERFDNSDQMVGRVVALVAKDREYDGKKYLTVSYYKAPPVGANTTATESTKAELLAQATKLCNAGKISDLREFGGKLCSSRGVADSSGLTEFEVQDAIKSIAAMLN